MTDMEKKTLWLSQGQTCPWVSRSLWQRWGLAVACFRVGGTESSSVCMRHFDLSSTYTRLSLSSLPPWEFGPRSSNREGTQPHPATENLTFTEYGPPIKTRPCFTLSQSLPSGSFHKPLIPIHHRANRMKTTITEN